MTYENWKVSIRECQENQELQDEYEIVANWCTNSKKYQIQEVGDEYCVVDVTPTEAELAQRRIEELKHTLDVDYDYKQMKYIRGEYTAEEWEVIKAEIQAITAEINELEKVTNQVSD